jgi:hypothetical protein
MYKNERITYLTCTVFFCFKDTVNNCSEKQHFLWFITENVRSDMYVEHNCKSLFGNETLSVHSFYDGYGIKRKEISLN